MNRYSMIKTLWELAGNDIEKPPHLQAIESEVRILDRELSEEFKEPIKQWEDGLISAVELLDKLMYVSLQEIAVTT